MSLKLVRQTFLKTFEKILADSGLRCSTFVSKEIEGKFFTPSGLAYITRRRHVHCRRLTSDATDVDRPVVTLHLFFGISRQGLNCLDGRLKKYCSRLSIVGCDHRCRVNRYSILYKLQVG